MTGRTDRGFSTGGTTPFSEAQRIYLLERDFDTSEAEDERWRAEVKAELRDIKRLVSVRLNTLVGLGFSLLIAVIAVLVTSQTQ
jgi:hypothetical protein